MLSKHNEELFIGTLAEHPKPHPGGNFWEVCESIHDTPSSLREEVITSTLAEHPRPHPGGDLREVSEVNHDEPSMLRQSSTMTILLRHSQRVAAKADSSALQYPGLGYIAPQVRLSRLPTAVAHGPATTQHQQSITTGVRQQIEQRTASLHSTQRPPDPVLAVNRTFMCKHLKDREKAETRSTS